MHTQSTSAPAARSFKPRLRPCADGTILVTLPCGETTAIRPVGSEWSVDNHREYFQGKPETFVTMRDALSAAARGCKLDLPALKVDALALARQVEADQGEACKILRRLLRERSGRDWSVRKGRWTSRSWIYISAPASRTQEWTMTIEDRILLRSMIGHASNDTIPGRRGHRGAMVFLICGVEIPSDWEIDEGCHD